MPLLQSGTYWVMAQVAGAAAGIPRNAQQQHARPDRCKEEEHKKPCHVSSCWNNRSLDFELRVAE